MIIIFFVLFTNSIFFHCG